MRELVAEAGQASRLGTIEAQDVSQATPRITELLVWYVGLFFGIATQLLFGLTVVCLFQFLRYGTTGRYTASSFGLAIDLLLAIGFAWPHSVLLIPQVQSMQRRFVPVGWVGCIHCSVTCLSLLLLFYAWIPSSISLWHLSGPAEQVMLAGFYASWLALFYSLALTGLGYQTGVTQWWYWLRNKSQPRRKFVVIGVYRLLRHPVYLSFLGLIWFTPHMTLDHALLTLVWTAYIFIGSIQKDRRLAHFIGPAYREYATRVAGYPLIGFGSLGKWKSA